MVPVSKLSAERSNHKRVNTDISTEPIQKIPFTSSEEQLSVSSGNTVSSHSEIPIKSILFLSHQVIAISVSSVMFSVLNEIDLLYRIK